MTETKVKATLSNLDYGVFLGSLVIALAIGIYQAWKGRSRSQKELLVSSEGIHLFPITLSLIATYLSAILLLGVRILGSTLYVLQMTLYMGTALYAPVIAVSAVTDMPEWIAIIVAGGICTFYTAIGGLRAVVWTDAFQVGVMLLGVVTIIVYGVIDVGGLSEVWRIAGENHRATFFNWSLDPFERHAFIWVFLNVTTGWMLVHGGNQSSVQRYSSLRTLREAKWAVLLNIPGVICLVSLACFSGVVIFSNYAGCDPLKAGFISKKDQIIPYYVLDKLGHLKAVPGIFLACLFSGALSTLSSGLNSLAAVTWQDALQFAPFAKKMSDNAAKNTIKIISLVFGIIAILFALYAGRLGSVLQVTVTVTGVIGAPLWVLMFTSVIFPFVNTTGVVVGTLSSLMASCFLGFGSYAVHVPSPEILPTSIDECVANVTLAEPAISTLLSLEDDELGWKNIFRISYLLYQLIGMAVGLVVTIVVSLCLRGFVLDTTDPALVHGWSISLFQKLGFGASRRSYDFGHEISTNLSPHHKRQSTLSTVVLVSPQSQSSFSGAGEKAM
ncbi:unnamed protein product [Cyprideis torosa]|uniref:Uncharacterized protein n=1 Tax=Cyprideis torosa TaxID=163714 RepID=A0A7R8W9D2_9CRUS|nr:unnamed protein product [Cyprideis torosa]CAG0884270.1 unnamed protein product [Cyprideis torosa]